MEARNLRNMTIAQTPLLGDENTPLHAAPGGGTGFEGATPRHSVAFTPNPLATPFRAQEGGSNVGATPRVGATPMQTPLRDNLAINPADVGSGVTSAKRALRAGFQSLPKPENNFELLVPEDEDEEGQGEGRVMTEDAAERDARIRRAREEEERKALARRSRPVQMGLPRPANVDPATLIGSLQGSIEEDEDGEAERLVFEEMAALMRHDAVAYPLPGTMTPGGVQSTYVPPPDDDVALAKDVIRQELASVIGYPGASEAQVREGLVALANTDTPSEDLSWAATRPKLALHPKLLKLVDPETLDLTQRVEGYTLELNHCRDAMTKIATKAAKSEKKLGVVLGGYQLKGQQLSKRLTDAFAEIQQTQIELVSFQRLRANEAVLGPRRVAGLKEEVDRLESRERALQGRYAELEVEKREGEARVNGLEDKVMEMVEAMNEASLAEMEEA